MLLLAFVRGLLRRIGHHRSRRIPPHPRQLRDPVRDPLRLQEPGLCTGLPVFLFSRRTGTV
jgi:hypothetical protein